MDVTTHQRAESTSETRQGREEKDRRVWTVTEVAVLLGISRAHAYDLVAQGAIPHLRLGRRIVVPKVAVDELLRGAGWSGG